MNKIKKAYVNIFKNKNKGITLISLVITIVIMLILAAVTINLVIGDNGLFSKAKTSSEKYKIKAYKEDIERAINEVYVGDVNKTQDDLVTELPNLLDIEWEDADNMQGEYQGYAFTIDDNSQVIMGKKVVHITAIAELGGNEGEQKWFSSDVDVKLYGINTNVQSIVYSINDGDEQTVTGANTVLNITTEGETPIRFKVIGDNGESKEKTVTVKIDKTAPNIELKDNDGEIGVKVTDTNDTNVINPDKTVSTAKEYSYAINKNGTYEFTAKDRAGNEMTQSIVVTAISEKIVALSSNGGNTNFYIGESGDGYVSGSNGCGEGFTGSVSNKISAPLRVYINPNDTSIKFKKACSAQGGSLVIGTDNKLYAAGFNWSDYAYGGQLGAGSTKEIHTPQEIVLPNNEVPKDVGMSFNRFSLVLTESGNIYATGFNQYGYLGSGTLGGSLSSFTKANIPDGVKAVQLSVGTSHSVFLGDNNKVYTFGKSGNGQLGRNAGLEYFQNALCSVTPTQVEGLPDGYIAKQVVAGNYNTYVLLDNGDLYGAGNNSLKQIKNTDDANFNTFVKMDIPEGINIKKVIGGDYATYIIDTNGTAYSVGNNSLGNLGLNDTTNRTEFTKIPNLSIEDIKCNFNYSAVTFLTTSGKIYGVGRNYDGYLGLNTSDDPIYTLKAADFRQWN